MRMMGITLNKEINTKELTRNETPGNISKEGNFKTDYLDKSNEAKNNGLKESYSETDPKEVKQFKRKIVKKDDSVNKTKKQTVNSKNKYDESKPTPFNEKNNEKSEGINSKKINTDKLTNEKTKKTKNLDQHKVSDKKNSEKDISKNSDISETLQNISTIETKEKITKKLDHKENELDKKDSNSVEGISGKEKNLLTINHSAEVKKEVNVDKKTGKKVDKKDDKKSDSGSKDKIIVNDLRKADIEKNKINLISKNSLESDSESVKNSDQELQAGKNIVLGATEITAEGDGGKNQAPVTKEFSSLLKQQLKDFGNNDIVKQSRFILKDNNIGEIKLILKPESLGEVKINLNFKQNSLAGQIVVENSNVKEIFQENMNNLTRAFEEQGYENTNLQLSLNDKKGSNNSNRQNENKQYFSERLKRIDKNGNVVRVGFANTGINLTA